MVLDLVEQVHKKASGVALVWCPSGQHLDGPDLCRFYPCAELYGLHKVELGICLLAQPHVVGFLAVLIHHEPDGVEDAVVQDGYVGLARHAACHH